MKFFSIKYIFITHLIKNGKQRLSENIYKIIFKYLLKFYNKKDSTDFIRLLINYFLRVFKVNFNNVNFKSLFFLSSRLTYSVKFIIKKFSDSNFFLSKIFFKDFLLERNSTYTEYFDLKRIFFFYRW